MNKKEIQLEQSKMIFEYKTFFKKNGQIDQERKPFLTSSLMQLDFSKAIPYADRCNFCLNDPSNYFRLIQKNERQYGIVSEALIKTLPTKYIIKSFKQYCNDVLQSELQDIMEVNVMQSGKKQRLIDIIETRDIKNGIAAMSTFFIPVFKDDYQAKEKIVKELSDMFFKFGYGLAQEELMYVEKQPLEKDIEVLQLSFEAKYPEYKIKFNVWFYHITLASNLLSISQHGLVPHSSRHVFKYPDRVYLFNNEDFRMMLEHGIEKVEASNELLFALLRINAKAFTTSKNYFNGNPKLYVDSKLMNIDNENPRAMFTYEKVDRRFIDDEVVLFKSVNSIPMKIKKIDLVKDDLASFEK